MNYVIVDLIPYIEFSPEDKLIYGPIAGSMLATLLGVLVGAGISYYVSYIRNNRDKIESLIKSRTSELTYLGGLMSAVSYLYLDFSAVKNSIKQRIESLPRSVHSPVNIYYDKIPELSLPQVDLGNINNGYLMQEWRILDIHVRAAQRDIEQLENLYGELRKLANKDSKQNTTLEQTILEGGKSVLVDIQNVASETLRITAIAGLVANYAIKSDIRLAKRPSEASKMIENIYEYEPSHKNVKLRMDKLQPAMKIKKS